jgi:AraC-like DNA-binding protein
MLCDFDIRENDQQSIQESRRQVNKNYHYGTIHEFVTPDGIGIRYYNVDSNEPGKIIIKNERPFIQLSYTISGNKQYMVRDGSYQLASFKKQEYNYMYFTSEQIQLKWEPGERIEIFELSISPQLMLPFLPKEHPLLARLCQSMKEDESVVMSDSNLFLKAKSRSILYDILHCPLEGRYKELYIKSKIGELLALELEAYGQQVRLNRSEVPKAPRLKRIDIERMHLVKGIILANLQNPCSLIDLAHQVGTNDTYLKRHFKAVFGTTVYGFLQDAKMEQARKKLLDGHSVSETAFLMGYKHAVHFTRAFKKYFGISPNQMRQ